MDTKTARFYARNARACAARYSQVDVDYGFAWEDVFPVVGARILDVGCGAGRDAAKLLLVGYDVYALEPVAPMAREAISYHPELTGRIFPDALPLRREHEGLGLFDGIICSAVLMHIPQEELAAAANDICKLLKDRGRLLVSVPAKTQTGVPWRDADSRLFVPTDEIFRVLTRPDLSILHCTERPDSLGRSFRWTTAVLEYRASNSDRSTLSRLMS